VRRAVGVGVALATALALGGCSLVGSSSNPQPTNTLSGALTALVPTYPAKLTAAKAKSETVRTADAIQALIATTEVVHVDNHAELVAATKTTGAYYGIVRAITTTKGFSVIEQGQAMEKLLIQAGWIERQSNTTTTGYMVAMSTYTNAGASVLELVADETPGTPPGIELELESPDLPK
jgi:hypothetical protein